MIYLIVIFSLLIVISLVMAFISVNNGLNWLMLFLMCSMSLFVSVVFYFCNLKYDVKITDINGKEYVYKEVHGLTDDRSGTVSFTDKNGKQFSYRVSSMTTTDSK